MSILSCKSSIEVLMNLLIKSLYLLREVDNYLLRLYLSILDKLIWYNDTRYKELLEFALRASKNKAKLVEVGIIWKNNDDYYFHAVFKCNMMHPKVYWIMSLEHLRDTHNCACLPSKND